MKHVNIVRAVITVTGVVIPGGTSICRGSLKDE